MYRHWPNPDLCHSNVIIQLMITDISIIFLLETG